MKTFFFKENMFKWVILVIKNEF